MKNIFKYINNNKNNIIRNSFLLPILLVVIISISHVVSWYDIGNPINWAIYLSIAIEVFALASVSAASIKINRTAIWFLFGLVTLIQMIGNVFFSYQEIDIGSYQFQSWVELLNPLFVDMDLIDHRRILALIQGGTLPIMSLSALHFYIKFNDKLNESGESNTEYYDEEYELDEDGNIDDEEDVDEENIESDEDKLDEDEFLNKNSDKKEESLSKIENTKNKDRLEKINNISKGDSLDNKFGAPNINN